MTFLIDDGLGWRVQKIFRPSLYEMLPRWQTAVEVWPVSTSLIHRAGLDAPEEILHVGPVLVRAAALDRRGTVALGDHLKTPAVKVERGVGAVKLHAVAGIAADAVVVAFPHLIELDERPVRAVEWSTSQRAATETSGDRMKTSRLWLPWPPRPMSATQIVSLGAAASPRAVRTAGWSADQVAIPAVDAATNLESSMKFRRLSSSLMGSSSGRTSLEIRVGNNEPRSHFGSNGALRGKQERGGHADMVW